MPIRTPRGRSAAYRALWEWPLRSPARLGLCVVLVLAVVVGAVAEHRALRGARAVGSVARTGVVGPGHPRGVAHGLPATIAPTVLPPVPALAPSSKPLATAPSTALSVAGRWVAAWVDHPQGITSQQWVDGLRPFTTDEYLGVLTGVDPANIPASRVTGRAPARAGRAPVPAGRRAHERADPAGAGRRDRGRLAVAGYDRV